MFLQGHKSRLASRKGLDFESKQEVLLVLNHG